MAQHPLAFGALLQAYRRVAIPQTEIVIVGADDMSNALHTIAARAIELNRVRCSANDDDDALSMLSEGRVATGDTRARAYVCTNGVCQLPVTTPDALARELTGAATKR
jgi:uncharacterized protein YyaL (SSP411 family)